MSQINAHHYYTDSKYNNRVNTIILLRDVRSVEDDGHDERDGRGR